MLLDEVVKSVAAHDQVVLLLVRWVVLLADDHQHFAPLRLSHVPISNNREAVHIHRVHHLLDGVSTE